MQVRVIIELQCSPSLRDVKQQLGIWNAYASHPLAQLLKKKKNQTLSCSQEKCELNENVNAI